MGDRAIAFDTIQMERKDGKETKLILEVVLEA